MIKLILTDMDGTFLNSKGDFNRELYPKVRDIMKQKNVYFAPCTGKQCERIEELFGEDSKDLWILGDSATRIKHNGKLVYESLLNNKLGLEIIDKIESISSDLVTIVSTSNGAIIKDSLSDEMIAHVKMSYAHVQLVHGFKDVTEDFSKITIYDSKLGSAVTKRKLGQFSDRAYIIDSEPAWIDITDINVHKGTTVERLQKILNVTSEETMVFGDGLNDVELMATGLYSFAMRNGCDETKEAANFITRTNDEDAVMRTIIQILSLQ